MGAPSRITDAVKRLLDEIKRGNVKNVYLLHGEEGRLIDMTVDHILDLLLTKGGRAFDLDRIDFRGAPPGPELERMIKDAILAFDTYPVLEDHRIIVLRNLPLLSQEFPEGDGRGRVGEELLLDYIKRGFPRTTIAIFTFVESGDDKVSRSSKLYKAISGRGEVVSFSIKKGYSQEEDEAFFLVQKRLRGRGKSIGREAFERLRQLAGSDIGRLYDEVDKLAEFTGGRSEIGREDVEIATSRTDEGDIFGLMDALLNRDAKPSLHQLNALIQRGNPPLQILFMIARQLRFLIQAHIVRNSIPAMQHVNEKTSYTHFQKLCDEIPPELAEKLPEDKSYNLLKQHPYVIYKVMAASGRFGENELRRLLGGALEVDVCLKSTRNREQPILETFICEICGDRFREVVQPNN
ncbi:MAG: DNA polymerase III subunit delta [bacterium]